MTKYTQLIIFCFFLTSKINAQLEFDWAVQFGNDYSVQPRDFVVTDNHIFTTGSFRDTFDFDPTINIYNLISEGGSDVCIFKLDEYGSLIWAKKIGGTLNDGGSSITSDQFGNVYTAGQFQDTVDFNPNNGVDLIVSNGVQNGFLHKMTTQGDYLWTKKFEHNSSFQINSIEVDSSGNIYSAGSFNGTIDFDPSGIVYNLTSQGTYDIFLMKMDSTGSLEWVDHFPGLGNDWRAEIKIDQSQNICLTGVFENTIDLDPGINSQIATSSGDDDFFVIKISPQGQLIFGKTTGGIGNELVGGIDIDESANIYLSGAFSNTVDFDPNGGNDVKTALVQDDIFIQKLDSSGNHIWVKQMEGDSHDYAFAICVDSSNLYISGQYSGTVDFDPGVGFNLQQAPVSGSLFIQKMDTSGQFLWMRSLYAQSGIIYPDGVGVDNNGNVYYSGSFAGIVDFDIDTTVFEQTSIGNLDCYLLKLNENSCTSSSHVVTVSACESYNWVNGENYTSDKIISQTLIDSFGCDSIVTLDLTINYPIEVIDSIISCDSLAWIDGNIYAADNDSAMYVFIGGAANGCDSIVTLNLTINEPSITTDAQIACEPYTWIDGDTYTSDNNTATYIIPGGSANGCDSIVTLNLSVTLIDNSVSIANNTLTSNYPSASYQWLDCDNNWAPIAGELGQSYTATQSGNYAVQVVDGFCSDTSACNFISVIGIESLEETNYIQVYPNPTNGLVHMFWSMDDDISLTLFNSMGKEIFHENLINMKNYTLDIKDKAVGIYYIEIESLKSQTTQSFRKKILLLE